MFGLAIQSDDRVVLDSVLDTIAQVRVVSITLAVGGSPVGEDGAMEVAFGG